MTAACRHVRTVGNGCWRALALVTAVGAGVNATPKPAPAWLDTIPPRVTALPAERIHGGVFHIVLSANEDANIMAGIGSPQVMAPYTRPISVTDDGPVVVYFQAEDDFGNRSKLDSVRYVLDTRAPEVRVVPRPGRFRRPVTVHFVATETCRFYLVKTPDAPLRNEAPDSFVVTSVLEGRVAAVDVAGNVAVSEPFSFVVDTSTVRVDVEPDGGLFSTRKPVSFTSDPPADIFYSFDPLAPVSWFQAYREPVALPAGVTLLRYYARTSTGAESGILSARFVVDTIPPRLRVAAKPGPIVDTVFLSAKEAATVNYTIGGQFPDRSSPVYRGPITVPRRGRGVVLAVATDSAGNSSDVVRWEEIYDKEPPQITLSSPGGSFNRPVTLTVSANEPVKVFYTLDGSVPTTGSLAYTGPVTISAQGQTVFRCVAVDDAGNVSRERGASFLLDTKPPVVRVRIETDVEQDNYLVTLSADEQATIYYEFGDRVPTRSSPKYGNKIPMKGGQTLRYLAVDRAGNTGQMGVMEELTKPMVEASVAGGPYSRRLAIGFTVNLASIVMWRFVPDSAYHTYRDSIVLDKEGSYTLEYFSRSPEGLESPTRRGTYFLDWTAPRVDVTLRKGAGDSVAVFFECSENASIFYTLDGTSPFFSMRTRTAGNKQSQSRDRISVRRSGSVKLAFYAEDATGNQSALTVIDLAKPRAVPSIPAGGDRIYQRFLSVGLGTVDERSQIYFARHGHTPTVDSQVYSEPITLVRSDTIVAFVVDAAGFRGDPDTLVYLIDVPPSPEFTVVTKDARAGQPVVLDASMSVDQETPRDRLRYRWDFDGDGTLDTEPVMSPKVQHAFAGSGMYPVRLEVTDEGGRRASVSHDVRVAGFCPEGMAFFADSAGRGFCIDEYEWPNAARRVPRAQVTWVEAKMACEGMGKRLCTADEWMSACRGGVRTEYPYGSEYVEGRCPARGEAALRSGSCPRCGEGQRVHDMVGNLWEWVETKDGDYPLLFGGSYLSGENARCIQRSVGTVGGAAADVGFRCCR